MNDATTDLAEQRPAVLVTLARLDADLRFMVDSATNHEQQQRFTTLFAEAFAVLGLTPAEIANDASVSAATVTRWRTGVNVPSAAQRDLIYRSLRKRVTKAMKDPSSLPKILTPQERHAALVRLAETLRFMLHQATFCESQDRFHAILIEAMDVLPLSDGGLAAEHTGARNTVNGWRLEGRMPSGSVRTAIYEILKRKIDQAIKEDNHEG